MISSTLIPACLFSSMVLALPQSMNIPIGHQQPRAIDSSINNDLITPSGKNTRAINHARDEVSPPSDDKINKGKLEIGEKSDNCTLQGIPFEKTIWVETSSDGWWSLPKDKTQDWTFSTTTPYIVFGYPSFLLQSRPGAGFAQPDVTVPDRTYNNMTVAMSVDTGSKLLSFLVYKTENGDTDEKYWAKPADDPDIPKSSEDPIQFELTVKGYFPCSNPIGQTSCANNTIERTPEQWEAYGVNEFLDGWLAKQRKAGTTELMEQFRKDYVSSLQHTCTVREQCDSIGSCSNLPEKGTLEMSPQAYLTWIAMENLSDTFHNMWSSVFEAQSDVLTQIASLALKFNKPPPENKKQEINNKAWAIASGVLGIFSGVMGFIPGAIPAASVSRIVGSTTAGAIAGSGAVPSVAGIVSSIVGLAKPIPSDPPPFDAAKHYAFNEANITSFLGQYTIGLRNQLESAYNQAFGNPLIMNRLLQDGQYVNRTILNLNCNECETQRSNWLKQYITLRMINEMWLENNVFVTYVPYGKVTQVASRDETDFTGKECFENFLKGGKDDEDELTVCMKDGMARLAWFDPYSEKHPIVRTTKDGQGKIYVGESPPGWDQDPKELTVFGEEGEVKWKASDAVESSIQSFLEYGFQGDGIDAIDKEEDDSLKLMEKIFDMQPNSTGVFSLPVCTIRNLNNWPTLWSSSDNVQGQASLCFCEKAEDQWNRKFVDNVNDNLKFVASHRLGSGYLHNCNLAEVDNQQAPWEKDPH